MKILFVFPSIDPGGAEKAAILYANHLLIYNHEIHFFIFNKSDFYDDLIDSRITIEKINNVYKKNILDPLKSFVKFPALLFFFYFKKKFDVIISIHEDFAEWPIIINYYIYKIFSGDTKYISIIQRSVGFVQKNYFDSPFRSLIYKFISQRRKSVFDALVCVSEEIYNSLEHKKKVFLPNPVSFIDIQNSDTSHNFNNLFKLENHEDYFINVGRICKQKNQELLIEALHKLKQNNIDSKLIIIGEITEKTYYMKLIELIEFYKLNKNITILQPARNYYYLLKKAKAQIFSSIFEGMPLALIESIAVGTPIISTKFAGYESLLNENNCLFFKDEDELFRLLAEKVNLDIKLERIKQNSGKFIENYKIEMLGPKFNSLVASCHCQ